MSDKMKKKKPTFIRKNWYKISRLGRKRRNKQVWRKPKGRHSKLRTREKGGGNLPSIGYRGHRATRGTLEGLKPVLIRNEKDLSKMKKGEIAIIAKNIGLKKRIRILERVKESGIKFANLDIGKFLADSKKQINEKSNTEIKKD